MHFSLRAMFMFLLLDSGPGAHSAEFVSLSFFFFSCFKAKKNIAKA